MHRGAPATHATSLATRPTPQDTTLTYIVSAEVYANRLLNRTEFRQLCDQKKTFKATVESLK